MSGRTGRALFSFHCQISDSLEAAPETPSRGLSRKSFSKVFPEARRRGRRFVMTQNIIVAVIIVLAALFLINNYRKKIKSKTCSCCGGGSSCCSSTNRAGAAKTPVCHCSEKKQDGPCA